MAINIIPPRSAMHAVPYPQGATEFELQAWLYSSLRAIGVDVRGEVNHDTTICGRVQHCRFDLVIYGERQAASMILEIKAGHPNHRSGDVKLTRQCGKYTEFGVPVMFVYGMAGAREALGIIQKEHSG